MFILSKLWGSLHGSPFTILALQNLEDAKGCGEF